MHDNELKNVLDEFMVDLKISGYDEKDRFEVLKGGVNTYQKLKRKESKGIRPFYRSSIEQKMSRKVNHSIIGSKGIIMILKL